MVSRWTRWWWLLPAVLLLFGLIRLRFDVEILNLLPSRLPVVQGLQLYQTHFANTRELILTLEAPDRETAAAAAESLAKSITTQTNLASNVNWQAPGRDDPSAAAEFTAYLWLNQPREITTQLLDRLQPEAIRTTLLEARDELATALSPDRIARLSYDPLSLTTVPGWNTSLGPNAAEQDLFASADGRFRAIFIQGPDTISDYRSCAAWIRQVRQLITTWKTSFSHDNANPQLEIKITGQPAFMAEIGGGMEGDLVRSVLGMFVVIGGLFYLAHRTWWPLQKLQVMLILILIGTLALGGLFFGELNVVSVGFAAMLLALAVDYGLVLYQEAILAPDSSARQLRQLLGPGIFCAALTTAGAFLAAALSGLPGLVQMGLLVGAGILLAAAIMLYIFLPWICKSRPTTTATQAHTPTTTPFPTRTQLPTTIALLIASTLTLLLAGLPKVDHGTEALRPLHSEAYAALENLKARFGRTAEPFWLLLHAPDDATMIQDLEATNQRLKTALNEGRIDSYTLPHGLWPNPANQAANRTLLAQQLPSHADLLQVGQETGFTERSLTFANWILESLTTASSNTNLFLPQSPLGQWALSRLADRSTPSPYALGIIHPNPENPDAIQLANEFTQPGKTWLTNWDALGEELLLHVQHDLKVILPAVFLLLLGTLTLTFNRLTEILLGFAALLLSLLVLQAVMSLAGWTWNLMNVIALPVLLGTGVDYSIHMQLALRRHNGNLTTVHHGVGRALLLCGATTIAGFASLTLSSNSGLASLGSLCATGMIFIVLTTVFLLPAWWRIANPQNTPHHQPNTPPTIKPATSSKFYRADLWQLALTTVRWIPRPALHALASLTMTLYWHLAPSRRHIVTQNLLPLFPQQPHTANLKAKQLYQQFGRKLVDLWLYESNSNIEHLFGQLHGAEGFHEKLQSKKGVLLVTP
ncbi:MAG: MMPL family transporter, partial [Limisphaerales bacterium]